MGPLSVNKNTNEQARFKETASGEVAVRVCNADAGEPLLTSSNAATSHNIYNVLLPVSDTEVSQALSSDTKQLLIKSRDGTGEIKFSFTSGESGTKFITIPKHNTYKATDLDLTGAIIYMQSPKAGLTVEIEEWS